MFDVGGSSPVDSVKVHALLRGLCNPSDFCGSLYHTLQAFAILHSCSAVPHRETAGQDGLHNAAVTVAEDFG